ncbi:MAG: translation initiation factor IF-2 [Candidatus Pacebacteria bacterium]|nr:translation initiation factor IF-2 [Candidatus Paceibacterota bacterium]
MPTKAAKKNTEPAGTAAKTATEAKYRRQPVVVVMGHIDHGKSTLLDYIRKTNVVAGEAGGITQSIGAYEAVIANLDGERRITFIDTPGHEAFSGIRERGAAAADVAILIVSAEDGVKPQTIEALKSIVAAKLPYIVAINKIDKPGANIEHTKQTLAENEIYIEGYGGDVPVALISAVNGTGIPDLLDMIYLLADMEDLTSDPNAPATGSVIEADLEKKKGIAATLIVDNGTLRKGSFIATETAFAPVRILENFKGVQEAEIGAGRPARVVGWSTLPIVGSPFITFTSKKDAEKHTASGILKQKAADQKKAAAVTKPADSAGMDENGDAVEIKTVTIPLIIRADSSGSLDGIHHELNKVKLDHVEVRIIDEGIGEINEKDAKTALSDPNSIILGFNVPIDVQAAGVIERSALNARTFKIIYELTDFVRSVATLRKPKEYMDEKLGEAKVLAIFGTGKEKQIIGGKVETGSMKKGGEVKVLRRGGEIGRGRIRELQQNKAKADEVREGYEFGALLSDIKVSLAVGDRLETFHTVEKK